MNSSAPDLHEEALELTQALIRIDSSNPPGGETAVAKILGEYLDRKGIAFELIGPDPERLNLVARIAGAGNGPSVALMGHTDVVPAPAADWSVPPFEARVVDGRLVARGATDMKNELAARAVAFAALARAEPGPAGDVVLIAESDEERQRSGVGLSWLVRERPELGCDFALNEGGGVVLELANGRRVITVATGEKQVTAIAIRLRGTAGHASVPARAENPLAKAAVAIERLLACEAQAQVVPAVERALTALGAPSGREGLTWAAAQHPVLAETLPAITRLTVTPTGLATHEPSNVIPAVAEIVCDCRALPGQTDADIRAHVARALGDLDYELELRGSLIGGTESGTDTALYAAIAEWVAERLPGTELLPVLCPGFTDSHWLRADFGTAAYGFAPVIHSDPADYVRALHSADEAIDVADLGEIAASQVRIVQMLGRNGARSSSSVVAT